MIDYLLVNPNNKVVSPFAGQEQPIWASLYASRLISRGKSVQILDAEALDLMFEETLNTIRQISPKEIVIFLMGNNPSVSSTVKLPITDRLIKSLIGDYKISVTGLHATALPRETHDELGVDVLRGKIFEGTPDIPYNLLPMDKYIAHSWQCLENPDNRKPYAVEYTSLGCSQNCAFCNVKTIYGGQNKVWYRDIDKFISEIDLLVNDYGVRTFKLFDEHFTQNKKRVNDICDRLIEMNEDLNIWAYARVDTINPEMLNKMYKAGIKWVGVGFESGDNEVLGNVNKRANINQAFEAVKMIHDAKISVMGNFIVGLPKDNLQSMQKTMDLARDLNIEFINLYSYEPYPGSEAFKEKEKDWSEYGQFSKVKNPIREFRDKAFNDYFTNPKYIEHIRSWFGNQAVNEVEAMLAFGKPTTRY